MSNKNLLNESTIRKFMKLAKLEPLTSGFVEGLTETTTESEELEEIRTGRTGALGPKDGTHNPGHGRGQGEAPDGSLFEEEELERELDATEDELGAEDRVADEEADELDAVDDAAAAEADSRMVAVDDFLSALERALEDVMGDEVEIDSDEMADEEEVEVADVDMGDDAGMEMDVEVEDDEMLEEEKKQGADDREDEDLGMKDGKEADKKQSEKDRRKEMRGARRADNEAGDPVPTQENVDATDDLVEQVTKRVAARILKSALAKK